MIDVVVAVFIVIIKQLMMQVQAAMVQLLKW